MEENKPKSIFKCNHCSKEFYRAPTPRYGRFLVNHACKYLNNKRKQFCVGRIYPKCKIEHTGPCIIAADHNFHYNEGYEKIQIKHRRKDISFPP
eukprot:UN28413